MLCLFRNVPPAPSHFSKNLQGEQVDFTQIEVLLPGPRHDLLRMIGGCCPEFDKCDAVVEQLRKAGHKIIKPHPSRSRLVHDKAWIVRLKVDYLESLVSCLDKRFGHFEPAAAASPGASAAPAPGGSELPGNVTVLGAFSKLLLLKHYPGSGATVDEVASHFKEPLGVLKRHYAQVVPRSDHVAKATTVLNIGSAAEQFLQFYPQFSREMRDREKGWLAEREADRNAKIARAERRKSRARKARGAAALIDVDSDTSDDQMDAGCPCDTSKGPCDGACDCNVSGCVHCGSTAAARVALRVTAAGLPMLEAVAVILANETICRCAPDVVILAIIAAVICPTSVEAERGFSFLKGLKTPARNLLSAEILDMMSFIGMNSPPLSSEHANRVIDGAMQRFFFDATGKKIPRRVQGARAALDKTAHAVRPWSTDATAEPHRWGWSFQDDPKYKICVAAYQGVLRGNARKREPPMAGEDVVQIPGANPEHGGGELARGCFPKLGSMTIESNDYIAYRWDKFGDHDTTWCAAKVLRSRTVKGGLMYRVRYDTSECGKEERDHDLCAATYGTDKSWVLLRAPIEIEVETSEPGPTQPQGPRQALVSSYMVAPSEDVSGVASTSGVQ